MYFFMIKIFIGHIYDPCNLFSIKLVQKRYRVTCHLSSQTF
ncbi:unnamed protein product [Musa textilis]